MHSQGWSPSTLAPGWGRPGTATVWAPVRGLCFSKTGLLTLWGGGPLITHSFLKDNEGG